MALYRLLENRAFEPEELDLMSTTFERACRSLGLAHRTDPLREVVAQKIIQLSQQGERDPARLCERVLQALRE
jgi:hypothetical protein